MNKMLLFLLFFASVFCKAEIKCLNDIMAEADPQEAVNLPSLLFQIDLISTSQKSNSGQKVMKVGRVEKGSLWDREGGKKGDLVVMGHSTKTTIELESKLLSKNTENTASQPREITEFQQFSSS